MTSEQWLALCKEAHGVKIAQDREKGVNVLMVDGREVWRDWSSEPEDMVMSRDLADMVITIRRLAQERDEARAHTSTAAFMRVERQRDEARAQVKAWQAEELARRTERDGAKAEAERMRDERDYWERRFEYADTHLSEAFNLSPMDNLPSGEAKRIVDLLRTERDEARAETQQLIELNRSHVATICEAQRNQVEALKAENERLQRLLDHATQSNPGTSTLVMLMNEASAARAEVERLRAERDAFYAGQKGALAEFSRREVHQRAYNAAFDREIERGKSPIEAAYIAVKVAYWDEAEAKGEP